MAGLGYLLYTAGQVLTAAQVNGYLMQQSVMVFATTAARDSALTSVKSEGMVTYQLDANDLDIYNGSTFSTLIEPAHGALTTYTPTLTQSATPTKTVTYASYIRIGRYISGNVQLAVTSSGTASNAVLVGIPITAVSGAFAVGAGYIIDSSAGLIYAGTASLASSVTLQIIPGAGLAAALGVSQFTAAVASGDTVSVSFSYQAAADA